MPEDTIAEKIEKIRLQNNMDRNQFARAIGVHQSTVQAWEVDGVIPKPENIKSIAELFSKSLAYFDEYYKVYYDSPGNKITEWRDKHKYVNADMCNILGISDSGVKRLRSGKIALSYEMYLKVKKAGILES